MYNCLMEKTAVLQLREVEEEHVTYNVYKLFLVKKTAVLQLKIS